MSTDPTAIEKKQNEKDEAEGKSSNDDWIGFGKATLGNFVRALIMGIVGANFIYYTTRSSDLLEVYFPTKNAFYGIHDAQSGGSRKTPKQKGGAFTCKAPSFNIPLPEVGKLKGMLAHLGIGSAGAWPYTMINDGDGIFDSFKNWFALSTAKTYQLERSLLKKFFALFAPSGVENSNPLSWNPILMLAGPYLIAPLLIWFSMMGTGGGFFVSSLIVNWKWDVFSLLMLPAVAAMGLGLVGAVQMAVTILLLPLYGGSTAIKQIINCNMNTLVFIFGALTVSSASEYLSATTAGMMLIAFIIMMIKMAFF